MSTEIRQGKWIRENIEDVIAKGESLGKTVVWQVFHKRVLHGDEFKEPPETNIEARAEWGRTQALCEAIPDEMKQKLTEEHAKLPPHKFKPEDPHLKHY